MIAFMLRWTYRAFLLFAVFYLSLQRPDIRRWAQKNQFLRPFAIAFGPSLPNPAQSQAQNSQLPATQPVAPAPTASTTAALPTVLPQNVVQPTPNPTPIMPVVTEKLSLPADVISMKQQEDLKKELLRLESEKKKTAQK